MSQSAEVAALLAPIPGADPAGEDLRYSQLFDEIQEARRADEVADLGEWQRELKSSEWGKVVSLCTQALGRSKDLRIAVSLLEALTVTKGFAGLSAGIDLLSGLIEKFWDTLYPRMEEGDLEYRIAPLEFLNQKLSATVRQIPLTDPGSTPGYSWFSWQQSRVVGLEAETRNRYGDVDEPKKQRREELIAEGKLTAEEFDLAVAKGSPGFRRSLREDLESCRDTLKTLERVVNEKFAADAPSLADLGKAIEDCASQVAKFYPAESPPAAEPGAAAGASGPEGAPEATPRSGPGEAASAEAPPGAEAPALQPLPQLSQAPEQGAGERGLWDEAVRVMEGAGLGSALGQLLAAAHSAPSDRDRNRCRLLVAKLCLKAGRPDLARPIAEELNSLIDELHLERWESPLWVAEVKEALYLCLTSGESSDEEAGRAAELFKSICTLDVTKAIAYRK